jgi:histidine triad (HIT) family protein
MNFLLSLARSSRAAPFFGQIIGWIFAYMSFVIPVKRLRETDTLLAFHHPKPSYPVHILLVPKKAIGALTNLSAADDIFLAEVFATAKELVQELDISNGYRLILNGGEYQDVPQLHFHLIGNLGPGISIRVP